MWNTLSQDSAVTNAPRFSCVWRLLSDQLSQDTTGDRKTARHERAFAIDSCVCKLESAQEHFALLTRLTLHAFCREQFHFGDALERYDTSPSFRLFKHGYHYAIDDVYK